MEEYGKDFLSRACCLSGPSLSRLAPAPGTAGPASTNKDNSHFLLMIGLGSIVLSAFCPKSALCHMLISRRNPNWRILCRWKYALFLKTTWYQALFKARSITSALQQITRVCTSGSKTQAFNNDQNYAFGCRSIRDPWKIRHCLIL